MNICSFQQKTKMKQLQKQSNSSIIFITHDLGVVAGMADRVAVMYAGKIVEYGTREILEKPESPLLKAFLNKVLSF